MPKLKFLIVEDDLFYQTYVSDLLADTGVDVITAADGEAGLSLALSEKPDLIITDIEIPKIQGFVLLRTFKERQETREIPVIMMSGKVEKDLLDRHSQLRIHADGYLLKPFSGQDLMGMVKRVMGTDADFHPHESREGIGDGLSAAAEKSPVEPAKELTPEEIEALKAEGPYKALVVDDSQYICNIVADLLQEIGFHVRTALDGEEGLKEALSMKPDLVLLDVQMPKMNGFVVCEMLRKEETTRDVPIVLMSAVVDGESFERHSKLRYHADAYLQKPFMKSELQNLVLQLLPRGENRRSDLESKTGFLVPPEDEIESDAETGGRTGPAVHPRVIDELQKARSTLEQLKKRDKGLTSELETVRNERDRLEDEVFKLRSNKEAREKELQDKLTLVTQRFEETRKLAESLEEKSRVLEQSGAGINGEAVDRKQYEDLLRHLEEATNRINALHQENEDLKSGLRSSEDDSELQNKIAELSDNLEQSQVAASKFEDENSVLRSEIEALKKRGSENGEVQRESKGLEETAKELEKEREGLRRDLTAALAAKNEIEEQVKTILEIRHEGEEEQALKKELAKISEKNSELLNRLTESESRTKWLAEVESQLEQAQRELKALQERSRESQEKQDAELTTLRDELSSALKKSESLQETNERYSGELGMNAGKIASLEAELENARKQAAAEEAKFKGLQEKIDQLVHVKEQRDELRKMNRDLEADLEKSKRVKEELEAKLVGWRPGGQGDNGVSTKRLNDRLDQLEETLSKTVREAQAVITRQGDKEQQLQGKLDTLMNSLDEDRRAFRQEKEKWQKREDELRFAFEDAIAQNRKIMGEEVARLYPVHLPKAKKPLEVVSGSRKYGLAAGTVVMFAMIFVFGYLLLSRIGEKPQSTRVQGETEKLSIQQNTDPGVSRTPITSPLAGVPSFEDIWRGQTVQSVSDDMMIQATLHSRRELEAAIIYTASKEGWTGQRREMVLGDLVRTYDLEKSYYVTVFSKNLQGGYPGYAVNLEKHIVLRDDAGSETKARLATELEGSKYITSRISAAGKEMNPDILYEVGVTISFNREELKKEPEVLQLVLYDVGAVPMRVLTWDMSAIGPLSLETVISEQRKRS